MRNTENKSRQERDKEFMEIYRSVFKEYLAANVPDARLRAINFALQNGRPRYHVGLDRAMRVVPLLLKGCQSPLKAQSMQDRMWREIAAKVGALRAGDELGIKQAIEFVLTHCRASRFFISVGYARQLVSPRRRKRLVG